jgi:hypothetical protein
MHVADSSWNLRALGSEFLWQLWRRTALLRIGRTADYTVDSSCAVTEVFADGLTFDGVIVAGGHEAFFIRTNPGTVVTALYKK